MKTKEITIRDPFVLKYDGFFYLYGTRGETCWGIADGFDCYISNDLEEWAEPVEVFHRPEGFWADRNYWAPECFFYHDKFYLVSTFGAEHRKKGIQILVSDRPTGPFEPLTKDVITPKDWNCIDGTLYWDDNQVPYLIFSHSLEDDPNGCICYLELAKDLKDTIGIPKAMISALDAPWSVPVPFAKEEFGMEGDVYFSDGPCMYHLADKTLAMLWSSWTGSGYATGIAYSESGKLDGNWIHMEEPLFPANGGHGMIFEDKKKNKMFIMHYPNDRGKEHPVVYSLTERNGKLTFQVF